MICPMKTTPFHIIGHHHIITSPPDGLSSPTTYLCRLFGIPLTSVTLLRALSVSGLPLVFYSSVFCLLLCGQHAPIRCCSIQSLHVIAFLKTLPSLGA